ncbi:hypothetical protein TWF694_000210 [Orbilia ellipsospora]|uniref:Uncharacterized protein n=1 Tax=Orbilia ellipsospora TaxID=2528407 RepID=A0AAV9XQI0_9PEZI
MDDKIPDDGETQADPLVADERGHGDDDVNDGEGGDGDSDDEYDFEGDYSRVSPSPKVSESYEYKSIISLVCCMVILLAIIVHSVIQVLHGGIGSRNMASHPDTSPMNH